MENTKVKQRSPRLTLTLKERIRNLMLIQKENPRKGIQILNLKNQILILMERVKERK